MKNSKIFCSDKVRIGRLYLVGGLLFAAALILGISVGSTPLSPGEVMGAFRDGFDSSAGARIFAYVRLPRTLAALICGGALAAAGAVIQNVLANPLASPGIIGVNAGAGLAVTVCTALGLFGGWQMSLFAFVGAFAAVMAVSLGAKRWGGTRGTLILMGVALNSLFGAMSDTVVTLMPEVGVMRNDFRVGEFSAVTYGRLIPAAAMIILALGVLLTLHNGLDVLTLGEETAAGLGMNTGLMRTVFLLLAALLAGCAVSLAGLLSFVGLMVPHAVRRLSGGRGLHLLGLSALFGGAFVCLCDTAARTAFAPYEIPVGIIMAFLGAPFFLWILFRRKGESEI